MSFPDTGPQEDGTRTAAQWLAAMGEDVGMVNYQVKETLREESDAEYKAVCLAVALKEARHLQSDIYRFAKEVHGIERATIDEIRT